MKLKLVKQGDFLGTKCDFYVNEDNNIFMSRTQIGYALKYKNPQNAITIIHKRNIELLKDKSIEVTRDNLTPVPQNIKKNVTIFMYNEEGIFDIVRKSNTEVADEYFGWVYKVIQDIKKNGYYIPTEKDSEWLGIRQQSKESRREETDEIKALVEYAKQQGSQNADMLYMTYSKLVNSKLGIKKSERSKLNQSQLLELITYEQMVRKMIAKGINENLNYKDIFQKVKNFINMI